MFGGTSPVISGPQRAQRAGLKDATNRCNNCRAVFGPRATTLAILPAQSVASAVWLGDLDGDGRNDVCADTGDAITCAVQP